MNQTASGLQAIDRIGLLCAGLAAPVLCALSVRERESNPSAQDSADDGICVGSQAFLVIVNSLSRELNLRAHLQPVAKSASLPFARRFTTGPHQRQKKAGV